MELSRDHFFRRPLTFFRNQQIFPRQRFYPISNFFKNVLQLFHQFSSMLDKSMQLFSRDDFQIFTDPPHPQFNDDTPHPRINDEAPP